MTEQELKEMEELIGQVEQKGLLQAPVHMKEEILSRCMSKPTSKQRQRQFVIYTAKVGLGMAAALYLLFSINLNMAVTFDRPTVPQMPKKQEQSITSKIYDGTNYLSNLLNQFSNQLLNMGGQTDDK